MAKILVVDDEICIVDLLKFNLVKEGHEVISVLDGTSVLPIAIKEQPDIILLDIMLPGADGFQVCRQLRNDPKTYAIPIIMLTAKIEEIDKILGLELGADDYVTKPFSPRELAARVKAQLRRRSQKTEQKNSNYQTIEIGEVVLIPEQYEAYYAGQKLKLSLKEFELLKLLITNPGRVLKRDYILENIWGYDYTADTRTVDVHVSYLRNKLEKSPHQPQYIETVRGIGYRFKG